MIALVVGLSLAQLFPQAPPSERPPLLHWKAAAGPLASLVDNAVHVEVFRVGAERWEPIVDGKRKLLRGGDRDLFGRSRLDGRERWWAQEPLGLAHFPIIAANPTPDWGLLSRLLAVLREGEFPAAEWTLPDGGTLFSTRMCGPIEPTVGFRFQTPGGFVELLICFGCQQAVLYHQGSNVLLYVDRVWPALLGLALESFPFDPVLNAVEGTLGD